MTPYKSKFTEMAVSPTPKSTVKKQIKISSESSLNLFKEIEEFADRLISDNSSKNTVKVPIEYFANREFMKRLSSDESISRLIEFLPEWSRKIITKTIKSLRGNWTNNRDFLIKLSLEAKRNGKNFSTTHKQRMTNFLLELEDEILNDLFYDVERLFKEAYSKAGWKVSYSNFNYFPELENYNNLDKKYRIMGDGDETNGPFFILQKLK